MKHLEPPMNTLGALNDGDLRCEMTHVPVKRPLIHLETSISHQHILKYLGEIMDKLNRPMHTENLIAKSA